MKSPKYFLVVLILLACHAVFAQRKGTQILLLGGPSLSSFYVEKLSNENRESYTGFQVGVGLKNEIRRNLNFVTGLRFQKMGSTIHGLTFTDNFGNLTDEGSVHEILNYVSLPAYVEYGFGKRTRFIIEAGLFIARLTKQVTQVRAVDPFSGQSINYNTRNPNFKDYNGGALLGINAEIPVHKNFRLQIGVRDELGLLVIKNELDENIKTNSLNFLAGIVLSL